MLIQRYFFREVLQTLLATTAILLFVFISTQFVRYLSQAALGKLTTTILFKLMLLQVPFLLGLLLPLGVYLALLLSYARFCADREMIVLQSCGFSIWNVAKIT